jgi:hypothetical protein
MTANETPALYGEFIKHRLVAYYTLGTFSMGMIKAVGAQSGGMV